MGFFASVCEARLRLSQLLRGSRIIKINAVINFHIRCFFFRDNLDWLARATNWAKFTATATLGVIHKGHENVSHFKHFLLHAYNSLICI